MARFDIKKITAVAAAAAVMSSLTACGENTTWGATIDGTDIPAGIFIYYLQSAYYSAQSKISEEVSAASDETTSDSTTTEAVEVFGSQIEGKDAKTWIYDEATKSMQEYAVIEAKFTELGLELTDDEEEAADVYCDQIWDYAGEYYSEMGISEKSYTSLYLNSQKRDKVFTALYSEGGEYAVADDDIKAYLDENYAMINYIAMELKDGEGNLLKSDGKAEIMSMAEDYVERYKNGEDFDTLNAEYTAYYDNLVAEAEAAAAAEEEAAAEETSDTDTEAVTAEVTSSDAQAALTDDADEITEADETEAAEDESGESGSDEMTAQTQADDSTDTEESTDDTAAEESAESDADTESDEETTDSGEEISSNKTVIEKSGTTPDSAVVSKVFDEMEKGDIQIIESTDSETYYVVLKMDIIETDEYFLTAKESLLYEMKSDEFSELVTQWTEAQSVERNQDAYDRYDPEKLFGAE